MATESVNHINNDSKKGYRKKKPLEKKITKFLDHINNDLNNGYPKPKALTKDFTTYDTYFNLVKRNTSEKIDKINVDKYFLSSLEFFSDKLTDENEKKEKKYVDNLVARLKAKKQTQEQIFKTFTTDLNKINIENKDEINNFFKKEKN